MGLPPGPEAGVTSVAEEIFIEQKGKEDVCLLCVIYLTILQQKKEPTGQSIAVTCRKCGGEHWTVKCPYKDKLDIPSKEVVAQLKEMDKVYKPPGARSTREGEAPSSRPPRGTK